MFRTPRCRTPLLALLAILAHPILPAAELEPVKPGRFAVAMTNLEVRPQADAKVMFEYLNGKVTSGGTRYLTDILVHPAVVPTLQLQVPADAKHYGTYAGRRVPLVLLVAYPTPPDNTRPDYVFPYTETGDRRIARMQRPGEKPIIAEPGVRHPLIVMSGGYNTHGLWHLEQLKDLASHGYIVVDLFHGDGRSADFAHNLALRGLALRAAIDHLLADPDFGPEIDPDRIGATGQSGGAHTVLAALGGIDPAARIPAAPDPRVKAAFGVVPFMGGSFGFWPFKVDAWYFGQDHAGLRGVNRPFFAVYGGKDSNVPAAGVESGLRALSGPAMAVLFEDEAHLMSEAAHREVRSWEILFFNCWLRDDAEARKQLEQANSVRGGVADRVTHRNMPPRPSR